MTHDTADQIRSVEATKIVLIFLTDDEREVQFARDYWAGNNDGRGWKWAETVQDIAARYGIQKHYVASTVRQIAKATDPTVRCSDCSAPKELESRTAINERNYGEYVCRNCQLGRIEARREELRQQEVRITERQNAVIAEVSSREIAVDYTSIDYFDAVVLYAIMIASDEACEEGTFDEAYRFHLCAGDNLTRQLLNRLFSRNLLRFSPDTPAAAINLDEGKPWRYDPYKVKWRISPDTSGTTYSQLFTDLSKMIDLHEEHPSYDQCLADLWWTVAIDDILTFLNQEISTYRVSDYRRGPKTDEAIRYALERLSIPEVRRAVRSVVKNAAALSVSRDYNRRHALNTIPGNLIRYVDRVVSNEWSAFPLVFDWQNEEPVLTTILFNRAFGSGLVGFKTTKGGMLGSPQIQNLV